MASAHLPVATAQPANCTSYKKDARYLQEGARNRFPPHSCFHRPGVHASLELQSITFDLKRSGIGVLVTDHNLRETLAVTDRAYIINEGRIFRGGSAEALGRDPEVKRVYLGESFSLPV